MKVGEMKSIPGSVNMCERLLERGNRMREVHCARSRGRQENPKLEKLAKDYWEGLAIYTKNWGFILREVEALMGFKQRREIINLYFGRFVLAAWYG